MSGSMLLYGLQSPINLGMILRVADIYKRDVFIFDQHKVLDQSAAFKTISDFAVGALQRRPPIVVVEPEPLALRARVGGRLIASDISETATDAQAFAWREDDCIVLGNEYDGLPASLTSAADCSVTIPMPFGYFPKPASFSPIDPSRSAGVRNEGKPSLNVATAGAVLACFAYCQLRR